MSVYKEGKVWIFSRYNPVSVNHVVFLKIMWECIHYYSDQNSNCKIFITKLVCFWKYLIYWPFYPKICDILGWEGRPCWQWYIAGMNWPNYAQKWCLYHCTYFKCLLNIMGKNSSTAIIFSSGFADTSFRAPRKEMAYPSVQ